MLTIGDIAWDLCSVLSYFLIGCILFPLRKNNWMKIVGCLCVSSVLFLCIDVVLNNRGNNLILTLVCWTICSFLEISIVVGIASLFDEDIWRVSVWLMVLQIFSSVVFGIVAQFVPAIARAIHENALQRKKIDAEAYAAACIAQLVIPSVLSFFVKPLLKRIWKHQWGMKKQIYKRCIQAYFLWGLVQAVLRTGIFEAAKGKDNKVGVLLFSMVYLLLLLVGGNVLIYYVNREYGKQIKTDYMLLQELSEEQEQQYARAVRENRALEEVRQSIKHYADDVAQKAEKQEVLKDFAEGISKENLNLVGEFPLSGNLVVDSACAGLYSNLSEKKIVFEMAYVGDVCEHLDTWAEPLVELLLLMKELKRKGDTPAYLVMTLKHIDEGIFISTDGNGIVIDGEEKKLKKIRASVVSAGGAMQFSSNNATLDYSLFLPEVKK